MSLTPGHILTDECGDSIGLTLAEVLASQEEPIDGPAPERLALMRSWFAGMAPALPIDTIPVRIRVGVTASGEWAAIGASDDVLESYHGSEDTLIAEDLANTVGGRVVAWHWVTASVPRPVVELGDVAGEVEP